MCLGVRRFSRASLSLPPLVRRHSVLEGVGVKILSSECSELFGRVVEYEPRITGRRH